MIKHLSSIRTKLLFSISVILFLSLIASMTGMYLFQKAALTKQAGEQAAELSNIINSALKYQMITGNVELTQRLITEIASYKNVRSAYIINREGVIKISAEPSSGERLLSKDNKECLNCHTRKEKTAIAILPTQDKAIFVRDKTILHNVTLIRNEPACFQCHPAEQEILGHLLIDYTTEGTDSLITATLMRILLTAFGTFVIMTLIILYLMNHWLHKPITLLALGVGEIKKGNYGNQIDYRGNTEFQVLAESFNEMSRDILNHINEIRNKGFELTILYTIVKKISESIYLEELKIVVVDLLIELMDCKECFIITPSLKSGLYEITKMNKGDMPAKAQLPLSEIAEFVSTEGIDIVSPLTNWTNREMTESTLSNNSYVVSLPLTIRDSQLGLLIAVREMGNPFDEESFRLITAAKGHLAVAFENARLYTLAITDELTNLFTIRHFQTQMEIELARYTRYGQKCSILMLDIDKFKSVNDIYGHPAGDKVLKEVASVIMNNLREIDIPCRYGGEEFVIILPGTSENGARLVAERIRKNLEQKAIEVDSGKKISVTISIGGACCPQHGVELREIVTIADKALYTAKERGRNRVIWSSVINEEDALFPCYAE